MGNHGGRVVVRYYGTRAATLWLTKIRRISPDATLHHGYP